MILTVIAAQFMPLFFYEYLHHGQASNIIVFHTAVLPQYFSCVIALSENKKAVTS